MLGFDPPDPPGIRRFPAGMPLGGGGGVWLGEQRNRDHPSNNEGPVVGNEDLTRRRGHRDPIAVRDGVDRVSKGGGGGRGGGDDNMMGSAIAPYVDVYMLSAAITAHASCTCHSIF